MTRKEKLIERLANHKHDSSWTFLEVRKLLDLHGFSEVRITGSHHMFTKPNFPEPFSIPAHGNKVKPIYISKIRKALL